MSKIDPETETEFQIGKNAEDNTRLVLSSGPLDVWFHIADLPSAHLVYRNHNGASLDVLRSNGTIYRMALELKKRSKYRKFQGIKVIYCCVQDVVITSSPGRVHTSNTRHMQV